MSKGRARRIGSAALSRYGLLLVVIALLIGFSIAKPHTYFTTNNFLSIAETQSITALLALAIICILTVGEFDLSFASIFGLCELLSVGLIVKQGWAVGIVCVAVLVIGVIIALANSFFTVKLKISSFVATLGVSTILGGLSVGYSHGEVVFGELPSFFAEIGQGDVAGIALPVVYVVIVAIALWVMLQYSSTGRRMLAVGGNRDAARLTGIRIGFVVMQAFLVAGVLSAFAGIVSGSQLGSGQPLLSTSYLLPAYAGAFLGATTITPGRFNVWGTLIGVYLLGAGTTGLQQIGLEPWVQEVFNGAVLLAAVAISGYFTERTAAGAASPVKEAS
jgi:ribose transport system permease protein